MAWPIDFQADAVLCVPELRSIFAMCASTDSVLGAWHQWDGRQLWRLRAGLKLLPPLHHVAGLGALCAGCFGGARLYEATTGRWLRQMATELPLDRVWHFEEQQLLCARSSEILGLTSQLTVWSTEVLDVASRGLDPASVGAKSLRI